MGSVAILASGNGSNFQAICESLAGTLHDVVGLICDRKDAPVLERAKRLQIPHAAVSYGRGNRKHPEKAEYEIIRHLERWRPDLIALAGFMRILSPELVAQYSGRIINIHPSLLPKYPGLHAIERSYAGDDEVVGITIHFVDDGVDTGPVIRQKSIARADGETLDELESRIHELEHATYPQVIAELLDGKLAAIGKFRDP